MKKRVIAFTGAGISAESGLKTFRDTGGLWEEYDISRVATPEAWQEDPGRVLEFYNRRRDQIRDAQPNPAHYALAGLEKDFDVTVVTQNIDDLHERAGSSNVLHLHGEVFKARGSTPSSIRLFDVKGDLHLGELCDEGTQLRPHVVWFGEAVPAFPIACSLVHSADVLLIVGTSLNVYPAAGILLHARPEVPKYLVDPNEVAYQGIENLKVFKENAGRGVPLVVELLKKQFSEKLGI